MSGALTRGGRRLRPAAALLAAAALAGWTGGCAAPAPGPAVAPDSGTAAAACAPAQGELAPGARADVLAGDFRLTLVATRGARPGETASGTLRLLPYGARAAPVPPSPGVRYPLYGGTDADLARVGAVALGDVRGADPARPGVLVMEWPRPDAPAGTNQVTLRLGADANQGGQQRFDGTFMALTVTSLAAERFAGTWESGGGDASAAGHFCAERIASRG